MFALLVPALMGALAVSVGSLISRAIIALGVGFVTYQGITVAIDAVKNRVMTDISAMPADMAGLLGYLWFDKALTLIFSAFAAALAMKAITGSVKKVVLK